MREQATTYLRVDDQSAEETPRGELARGRRLRLGAEGGNAATIVRATRSAHRPMAALARQLGGAAGAQSEPSAFNRPCPGDLTVAFRPSHVPTLENWIFVTFKVVRRHLGPAGPPSHTSGMTNPAQAGAPFARVYAGKVVRHACRAWSI